MNTVNTEKNEDRRLRVSPRPWKYRPDAEDIVDQHGRIIADFLGNCNGPERAANGYLMAAAPAMYAELKDLLDAMEQHLFPQVAPGVDFPAVTAKKFQLRKLLAAARGKGVSL